MTCLHLGACGFSTIHCNRLSFENQEETDILIQPIRKTCALIGTCNPQILPLLSRMRIPVLGTDPDGTITSRIDGKHVSYSRNSKRKRSISCRSRTGSAWHHQPGGFTPALWHPFAEYETEIRAERVHAGQQVARRKGKTWGGSEKGWRWKVSDEQVAAIQEMKAARTPIAKIARITGLSRPTIYRVLIHLIHGVR